MEYPRTDYENLGGGCVVKIKLPMSTLVEKA